MNPTEAQEAATLVAYLQIKGYKFHHSPNETGHTPEAKRRAIRMKREGTSKGFPDYIILLDRCIVAIELKRRKGSVTTKEQIDWIDAFKARGVYATIAKGADSAIQFIETVEKHA